MNSEAKPVLPVTDFSRGANRPSLIGRVFSERYEIERELGHGGMATVYLATDRATSAHVAVKVLHPELAMALGASRFMREVQIIKRLDHPNILKLLDSGVEDGDAYYVMPYVVDGTLRELLNRRTQLSVDETVEHAKGLAAGLEHAHQAGVVHRDVKPENILLADGRAILADFGIARLVAASGAERHLSTTGLVIGTPAYMSPEQATADPKTDARSDLYSLGCVMFEMLSGIPPFAGATPQAVAARHMVEPPPSIRVVRPNAPAGIAAIIERCLAKSPADRYQSARELREALETRAMIAARPRRAGWIAALGVCVVAVVGVLVWLQRTPALDETRYAVLPFRVVGVGGPTLLNPTNAANLVYEALSPVKGGLSLVDRARVESAIAARGMPTKLSDAAALARSLAAGRFIWGEVVARGDSTIVRAQLYRSDIKEGDPISVAAFAVRGVEVGVVGSGALAFFDRFVQLTRRLVVRTAGQDSTSFLGTDFMGAISEKLSGDSARFAWNLSLALQHYRGALEIDPQYPQASLAVAQIGEWLEQPTSEWRPAAASAVARGASLSARDRALATGLLALADEDYPKACSSYQSLAERDTTDFEAWFGVGECHARDPVVVRDARSPSGYTFRGSFQAASSAYLRALRVVPLAYRADRVMSVGRIERVLPTSLSLRPGRLAGTEGPAFLAWPELASDTIAYVPFPWKQFTGSNPPAKPPSMPQLFERHRRLLDSYSIEWVAAFPNGAQAWHSRAAMLERLGHIDGDSDRSALYAIARARRAKGNEVDRAAYAVDEVRLLLRAGDTLRLLRALDSLATVPVETGETARTLAPIAALTGDRRRLRELLHRASEVWPFQLLSGETITLPRDVAIAALDLYWYALTGTSADSLTAFEAQLAQTVRTWVPVGRREAYLASLQHAPAQLGFPVFGVRPAHSGPLAPQELVLQRKLAADDAAATRVLVGFARALEERAVFDVPLESAYLGAATLLAVGDSAAAYRMLAKSVSSLKNIPMSFFQTPQGPASLRRGVAMLELRGDSAVRTTSRVLGAISRPR